MIQKPRVSVIIPAYQENEQIIPVLNRISEAVKLDFECLIVIDDPDDKTVEVVNEFSNQNSRFKYVPNTLGKGPANAIHAGFKAAAADVAVVTMADGSDDPRSIDQMALLVERGVVIASASRYMSGGQQVGATGLKPFLSKLAGLLLKKFAGVGTHDATNSFKAYHVPFVLSVGIESAYGFEMGLELVSKARRLRLPIAEIPTIWIERSSGVSNFKLRKWLPHYIAWFVFCFGRSPNVDSLKSSSQKMIKFKNRLAS